MLKNLLHRIHWGDVLTFLLFVLLAAVVWYGHAMQSVRNTNVPVFIHYTGKPNSIGLTGEGLPDTINIEIRDAGKRLITYRKEPLHLTIDLRPYIHGNKGKIQIPSDALRRSISDILQGTSQLIRTTPEQITCAYYTETEKTVPIVLKGTLQPAYEFQLVGSPTISPQHTTIYGKESKLNAIDTIYTEPVVLTDLHDTTQTRLGLTIPAGIRCPIDSIDIQIIAERYTEKKMTIPLRALNVPAGYAIRLFPHEVEVSVRVGLNHLSKVKARDIQATCSYTSDSQDKLTVDLHYTNPYITAAWSYPSVVEFLLEQ